MLTADGRTDGIVVSRVGFMEKCRGVIKSKRTKKDRHHQCTQSLPRFMV